MTVRTATVFVFLVLIAACNQESKPPEPEAEELESKAPELTIMARGAAIAGANGIHFSPDNLLYVASVMGSNITVINPETGEIIRQLGAAEGVVGPDDLAFNSDGDFYWTSILTGEVAGFTAGGERLVAAQLAPGVNPITFSDDGRLFVSQCFFGVNLYELDPKGTQPARLISDQLGPGCGLNGMDWGPDERLYGPRWFTGEIVSFNVDDNSMRVEATGFKTPAAVKFNSKNELHVMDTGTGEIFKLGADERSVIATLTPGLDNFTFDENDNLFVSSFVDGFVKRVEKDGSSTDLLPSGMAHPAGITLWENQIVVADSNSIHFFNKTSGELELIQRNVFSVGEMGGAINLAADGSNLILVSWFDNDVRVWDPKAEKVIERYSGLAAPTAAVRYSGKLIATEHGNQRVVSLGESGVTELFSMEAPTGMSVHGGSLYVTDRELGRIYRIGSNHELLAQPEVVVEGLDAPEGVAASDDGFIVMEAAKGNIVAISEQGERQLLANIPAGSEAATNDQPPSMFFNGVGLDADGTIYVTGEASRMLYKISRP
ncbi:MAG: hypothetical protein CMQ20_06110 [Gammaproteobacteria bacterium]|jgi:sugar lactone lactonase YvrE|nr:hypothetical protein [Gammaproteobacteria bacterium]|tara:strand:- start:19332 stop:20969 length:1638 start_codon:yes stop_codon:yes gene_type:complete